MLTITVGGQTGAGGIEVGDAISRRANVPVVRKLAVRKLARRLNASVEAVVRKELSFSSRKAWLANAAEYAFWSIGTYGWDMQVMGDPGSWSKTSNRRTFAAQISTRDYVEAFNEVTAELVSEPCVIVKRGGCLSTRSDSTLHIGLFAGLSTRVARTAQRFGLGWGEASDLVIEQDRQRREWFRAIASVEPEDTSLYDITYDSTGEYDHHQIAEKIMTLVPFAPAA